MTSLDLSIEYARLRAQLETLQSAPEKDMPLIDDVIDRLEKVQLAIKGEYGIVGNNPNE